VPVVQFAVCTNDFSRLLRHCLFPLIFDQGISDGFDGGAKCSFLDPCRDLKAFRENSKDMTFERSIGDHSLRSNVLVLNFDYLVKKSSIEAPGTDQSAVKVESLSTNFGAGGVEFFCQLVPHLLRMKHFVNVDADRHAAGVANDTCSFQTLIVFTLLSAIVVYHLSGTGSSSC
jgi:hypothetical protein